MNVSFSKLICGAIIPIVCTSLAHASNSVSINFGTELNDQGETLFGAEGYQVPASKWNIFTTQTGLDQALTDKSGNPSGITFTWTSPVYAAGYKISSHNALHRTQIIDQDGQDAVTFSASNILYDNYDVIVYMAAKAWPFNSNLLLKLDGATEGVWHTSNTDGTMIATDSLGRWGDGNPFELIAGKNYAIFKDLTATSFSIEGRRQQDFARVGFGAIQIVPSTRQTLTLPADGRWSSLNYTISPDNPPNEIILDLNGQSTFIIDEAFTVSILTLTNLATDGILTLQRTDAVPEVPFGVLGFAQQRPTSLILDGFSAMSPYTGAPFDHLTFNDPITQNIASYGGNTTVTYLGGTASTINFDPPQGGTINLKNGDFSITDMPASATQTTLNIGSVGGTSVVMNHINAFNIGTMTATIHPGTTITAPRFLLVQGSTGQASIVNQAGGAITVTGNNSTSNSTASIMLGNWGRPSTYNLSGGTFTATQASVTMGHAAKNHTWDISNTGVAKVQGFFTMPGASDINTLKVRDMGRLDVGRLGITCKGQTTLDFSLEDGGTLASYESFTCATPATINTANIDTALDTTLTFTAPISSKQDTSTGSLTKQGVGTLVLASGNALIGSVAVEQGTLALSGMVPFTNTNAITLSDGATLDLTHMTNSEGSTSPRLTSPIEIVSGVATIRSKLGMQFSSITQQMNSATTIEVILTTAELLNPASFSLFSFDTAHNNEFEIQLFSEDGSSVNCSVARGEGGVYTAILDQSAYLTYTPPTGSTIFTWDNNALFDGDVSFSANDHVTFNPSSDHIRTTVHLPSTKLVGNVLFSDGSHYTLSGEKMNAKTFTIDHATLELKADIQVGSVAIAGSTLISRRSKTTRYIKWIPTATKDPEGESYRHVAPVALAEFRLYNQGEVVVWPEGSIVTSPGEDKSISGNEKWGALIDTIYVGSTTPSPYPSNVAPVEQNKWWPNDNGWTDSSLANQEIWFVITLPEAITFDAYDYMTGGYAPRNPKDWILQMSEDGIAWETIDTQTNQAVQDRITWSKQYALTPYAISANTLTIDTSSSIDATITLEGSNITLANNTIFNIFPEEILQLNTGEMLPSLGATQTLNCANISVGRYPFLKINSTSSGTLPSPVFNFINPPLGTNYTYTVEEDVATRTYTLVATGQLLSWNAPTGTWGNGVEDPAWGGSTFYRNDNVTFLSSNAQVTINGTVSPYSLIFQDGVSGVAFKAGINNPRLDLATATTLTDGFMSEVPISTAMPIAFTGNATLNAWFGNKTSDTTATYRANGLIIPQGKSFTSTVSEGFTQTIANAVTVLGSFTKSGAGILLLTNGFAADTFAEDNSPTSTKSIIFEGGKTVLGTIGGNTPFNHRYAGTFTIGKGAELYLGAQELHMEQVTISINGGTLTNNSYNHFGDINLTGGTVQTSNGFSSMWRSTVFDGNITIKGDTPSYITIGSSGSYMEATIISQMILTVEEAQGRLVVNQKFIRHNDTAQPIGSITKRGLGTWEHNATLDLPSATTIEAGIFTGTGSLGGDFGNASLIIKSGATIEDTLTVNQILTLESGATLVKTKVASFAPRALIVPAEAQVSVDVAKISLSDGLKLINWTAETQPAGSFILTGDAGFSAEKREDGLYVIEFQVTLATGSVEDHVLVDLKSRATTDIVIDSAEQAIKLYLFQLPISNRATSFKIDAFTLTDASPLTARVTVSLTTEGEASLASHAIKGDLIIKAGPTLDNLTRLEPTRVSRSTFTDGIYTFEAIPCGENRIFKVEVVEPSSL